MPTSRPSATVSFEPSRHRKRSLRFGAPFGTPPPCRCVHRAAWVSTTKPSPKCDEGRPRGRDLGVATPSRDGFAHCFIGGVALQAWGEPRVTRDVDVSVLIGFAEEERQIKALPDQFSPRIEEAFALATACSCVNRPRASASTLDLPPFPMKSGRSQERPRRVPRGPGCSRCMCRRPRRHEGFCRSASGLDRRARHPPPPGRTLTSKAHSQVCWERLRSPSGMDRLLQMREEAK